MTPQVVADLETILFQILSKNLRGKLHFRMNLKRNLSEEYLLFEFRLHTRGRLEKMVKIMEDKKGSKNGPRMTCRFGFGQFSTDR